MTTPKPVSPPDKLTHVLKPDAHLHNLLGALAAAHTAQEAAVKAYKDARRDLLAAVTTTLVPTGQGGSRVPDELILEGTPVRVSWITSMRIDSKAIQAELPSVWARYSKPSGAWKVTGL